MRAGEEADRPYDREHVTAFFRERPDLFTSAVVTHPTNLSHKRWTVDMPEDLCFVRTVYEHFGDVRFGMNDLLAFVEAHPEIGRINAPKT
jgi:spore coat polysaccharide biosynthesis protein SpsF